MVMLGACALFCIFCLGVFYPANNHFIMTNAGSQIAFTPGQVRASASPPVTSISYIPSYTSGSKKWVTASTSFTLNGGSSANSLYVEDFNSWPSGGTFTGAIPTGGGTWTHAGSNTAFIDSSAKSAPAGKITLGTANDISTLTLASGHSIAANDYVQWYQLWHVSSQNDYSLPGKDGSNYVYFLRSSVDNSFSIHDSGGWHKLITSTTNDAWYVIKVTFISTSLVDMTINGTLYNNGGSHFGTTGTVNTFNIFQWEAGTVSHYVELEYVQCSWYTVANTFYKWAQTTGTGSSSAAWKHYTAPFTIGSNNGSYTISYCSWNDADHPTSNETLKTEVVLIDTVAPTTPIGYSASFVNGGNTWISGTTTISLTATDNTGGSGIKYTYYKYSGTSTHAWMNYAATPFSISSNGTYTIQWCSWDNVGNNETLNTLAVLVDSIAPTTGISYTPAYTSGPKTWVSSSTLLTLTPSDNSGGSGVSKTYYKWSGSGSHAWTQYTVPFTLAGMNNGTYTISWCSWDNVGNNETLHTMTVLIDTIAPSAGMSYSPAFSPNFVNSTTLFTISAIDNQGGSGVASTYYNVNSSGWSLYSSPLIFGAAPNGTYVLQYYCVDNVGNVGNTGVTVVRLDTIAPSTVISYTPVYTSGTGKDYITTSTQFTLNAVDNPGGSGLAATYYKWSGTDGSQSWTLYSSPFSLTGMGNGTYTIDYLSSDNVGNIETTNVLTVFIDSNEPVTTISYTPTYTSGTGKDYVTGSTQFTLIANDGTGESGVQITYYRINTGSWTAYSTPFTLGSSSNGTYSIQYFSVDNAGNVEAMNMLNVYIDTIAPTATISPVPAYTSGPKTWVSSTTLFTLTPSDNSGGSGVNETWYKWSGSGSHAWTQYTVPFSLGGVVNGSTYTISWCSWDNAGNNETLSTLTVLVDTIAPTTTVTQPTYLYNSGSKNFTTGVATFTLNAADNTGGSSVATTKYRINDGAWATGTSFSINSYEGMTITNGTYNIAWNSTDNAGNVESTHHLTVYIDTTAPTTTITQPSYVYNSGTKNYTTGSQMFSLSASDNSGGSGVKTISYQINGGTVTTYAGPFSVGPANGTYTIAWHSTDNAGNVESTHHLTVYIDTIAPSAPMVTPTAGDMLVSLTWTVPASDGGSPITGYVVYVGLISGSEKVNATGIGSTSFMVTNLKDGSTYYFRVAAVNGVGLATNSSRVSAAPSSSSQNAPITAISFTPAYTSGTKHWVTGSTIFTLTAARGFNNSMVKSVGWRISGGSWNVNSTPVVTFTLGAVTNGTYVIGYNSTDVGKDMETTKFITVFVDTIAPTTGISYAASYTAGPKNWVTPATMFTLTPADNAGGSGVAATCWKFNGPGSHAWTSGTSFTLAGMSNGSYTISWCSWDNLAILNNETVKMQVVYIDTIAPTTTITQPAYLYNSGSKNFTTGSQRFSLSATDNSGGSGVNIIRYQINSGTVAFYASPFSVGPANGTYMITWYSTDNTNNVENTHHLTVYIDTLAPTTTITQPAYSYNSGSKNFTTGVATFTLNAADNAGGSSVATTKFRMNGGLWATGMSFSINSYEGMIITNGTYTIAWNSTDHAGNMESTHHLTVYIDLIVPVTTMTQPTYLYNSGSKNFTTGNATFSLTAMDNNGGSGVAITSYLITTNGVQGSWTSYTGIFLLGSSANGTYMIAWHSTDNAGNVEGMRHLTVYIDTIAPTTSISYTPASAPNHVDLSTTFTLTSQDSGGSGIASIQYQYTGSGGGWILYSTPFSLSQASNGTVVIWYRSIDNVGNVEVSGTLTVELVPVHGSSPSPQGVWDQYGVWIIVAGIGVAIAIAIGSIAARKKKTIAQVRSPGKKGLQKGKAIVQQEGIQPGTPGKVMAQPAWIQPATTASLSLDEVKSRLKHLFVFHARTGVCLFYQPFTEVTIDPQLIAGFIAAISSFGESFEKEAELKVLEYKNFKVLLEESVSCKYALLFSGEMNDKLNVLLKSFMGEFESKFRKALTSFDGNVSMFNMASEIMASVFKLTAPATNLAFAIDKSTKQPISESLTSFNLYCPHCDQWTPKASTYVVTGTERCTSCDQLLYFVPKCDICGNGFVKPVTEFNEFKNSPHSCEKCGGKMRIQ